MKLSEKTNTIAAFLPVIILLAGIFGVSAFCVVLESLKDVNGNFAGLKNFSDVISSYYFKDSLIFTLKISFATSIIAALTAIITALCIRKTKAGKKLVLLVMQYNIALPHIVSAMMIIMVLSNTGLISALLFNAGIITDVSEFPWIVKDSKGIGIIITFVWRYFTYIALSVLGILESNSKEFEEQAYVLGVGKFKSFFHVTLPQIAPSLAVSSIIVFAASFGEYEIPALMGSTVHRTLSVMIYLKYCDMSSRNLPQAYALMVLMMLFLILLIAAAYAISGTKRYKSNE